MHELLMRVFVGLKRMMTNRESLRGELRFLTSRRQYSFQSILYTVLCALRIDSQCASARRKVSLFFLHQNNCFDEHTKGCLYITYISWNFLESAVKHENKT